MIKTLLISSLLLSTHLFTTPYDELEQVLEPHSHGWFVKGNSEQLKRLLQKRNAKTVIEVGVWLGKSAIFMAEHLPEEGRLYAIDHWVGSVEHHTNPSYKKMLPTLYEQFLSNVIHANLQNKIVPMRMTSLEAAEALKGKVQPDLIYIDASHDTASVLADLNAWYPFVVESGGVLCGDDYWFKDVQKALRLFARKNHLTVHGNGNFWILELP